MYRALFIASALLATSVAHAGSVRIQNSDSQTHVIELRCSGSSKKVEVRPSTTATYTFHSTAKSCDITGGSVKFSSSTLEDGQRWRIQSAKATKE